MQSFTTKLQALAQRESGQTMAEYSVVLAVISIGILVALLALAGGISGGLDAVTAAI